eukprot:CAMPEP_0205856372 /NCGR_PEP_ID=MMETSP1083-20121108/3091_1 /ASSEMBLY_ACC=CAM_ASM_000430 /TAXON_ID=97485 /ORGANISM="Prymnesium parvum, Strain Texoma1" /LENGTH=62 /DNA_ID=CAMNT_0053217785 /DNA_START=661 /DNA_END=849 /DNA_ORIENTATION=-
MTRSVEHLKNPRRTDWEQLAVLERDELLLFQLALVGDELHLKGVNVYTRAEVARHLMQARQA